MSGQCLDHGVDIAGTLKVTRLPRACKSSTPGRLRSSSGSTASRELHRDPAGALCRGGRRPAPPRSASVADDPDPVADPLDLIELVEERNTAQPRSAPPAPAPGTPPASADRGRWSARRGSAARVVEERQGSGRPSDGCRARAPPTVDRGRRGSARPASRPGRARQCREAEPSKGNRLAPGGELAVAEVAGQVAEPGMNRDAVAVAVEAEEPGAAPVGWRRSSRVRIVVVFPAPFGARGSRIPPRLDRHRHILDAAVAAVELAQPLGLDRRHVAVRAIPSRGQRGDKSRRGDRHGAQRRSRRSP